MKIINTLLSVTVLASAAVSAVPASAASVITPAYTYTSGGTLSDPSPYTLGFSFSLSSAQTVNALGYTTVGFTTAQTVGLWNSAGALLASVLVSPTGQLASNFRWADITPLTLSAGSYVLAGTFTGGPFPYNLQGVTTAPGYTYLQDLQKSGSGLLFPTLSTGSYGTQGIALVNLSIGSAVPEPATWGMMILGFGLVGGAMRRRSTKLAYA